MQPTTDTPFERFAFSTVILLTIVVLLLPVGLLVLLFIPGMNIAVILWGNNIVSVITLGVLIFYIICARKIERDHIKALARAEAELSDIILSDMKTLPQNWNLVKTVFVSGNVVLANDYFKAFLWSFRKLFGGESRAFSRLLSRARREATIRVLRQAKECGANVVWNIRYETSVIQTNGAKSQSMAGVEVLAYATAFAVEAE